MADRQAIAMETQENPGYLINPPVGPDPIRMTCPHCHKIMSPYIETKASARTHSVCIVCSLLGCFLCAPCVYCNKDCLAKEHYCTECDKYVGTYDG